VHLAFALLALVAIPLAQVPLVAFLSKYVELDSDASLASPGRGYVTYGTADSRPDAAPRFGTCPECGADLDPPFDVCGSCAAYVSWTSGDSG
jgi:hypothetical protein